MQLLGQDHENFIQTHEEITALMSLEEQNSYPYFADKIQEKFEELILIIGEAIEQALKMINSKKKGLLLNALIKSSIDLKLPPLKLPNFSGKYIEWNAFKDQFEALVHFNSKLAPVVKMQYLFNTLEVPVLNVVKHLPIINDSYLPAWTLLSQRYENKRIIFVSIMQQLIEFPRKKMNL